MAAAYEWSNDIDDDGILSELLELNMSSHD